MMDRLFKVFSRGNVDYTTFSLSLLATAAIAFFILYDAEVAKLLINKSYKEIVSIFGPAYLILTILFLNLKTYKYY